MIIDEVSYTVTQNVYKYVWLNIVCLSNALSKTKLKNCVSKLCNNQKKELGFEPIKWLIELVFTINDRFSEKKLLRVNDLV